MHSAYLFDFDYTLGDATNGIVSSVNFALEQMNISPCFKDDIRKTVGMHLSDTYTFLTKDNDNENQMRFAQLFRQKADVVMLDNTELFDDTETLLKKLKENDIKTAIVTTKFHYRITDVLNKFNITNLIDVIVGGEDVKNSKPHPEPIEMAIKQLNVKPKDCVFIGDSLIDAETAFNASIDFIAVTTGTTCENDFCKFSNTKIVNRLIELVDFAK